MTEEPVASATVKISATGIQILTDENGTFSIANPPTGELQLEFSLLGYRSQTLTLNLGLRDTQAVIVHLAPLHMQTNEVIITGFHENKTFSDVLSYQSTLQGKELEKNIGATIASTLKNETGISIRSMGPAPARPVIRGLSGDRVLISEDGNKTNDLSATSPDHAVSVEPFTVERIEVIRGPKILLENTSAIGGTVNIIRNGIPLHTHNITGAFGGYFESVNKGTLAGGNLIVPAGYFTLRGEYTSRSATDQKTPVGKLKNSFLKTTNMAFGTSFQKESLFSGASIREFSSVYGVPGGFTGAHPNGVVIDMFRREIQSRAIYSLNYPMFDQIELNYSRNFYRHIEFEKNDVIGAEFSVYTQNAELTLHHKQLFPWTTSGVLGISGEVRDFKVGGFVFTAPTFSRRFSAFLYENLQVADITVEFAGRYNYDDFSPKANTASVRSKFSRNRHFNSWSLALSILYPATNDLALGMNFSRTSRAPTIEELYSEGPHLAAYSYETGNPELSDEFGSGIEIFASTKNDRYRSMFSLFYYYLPYYIIPRNSGRINYATLLPVYETTGVGAILRGFESSIEYSLYSAFQFTLSAAYTAGNIVNDGPLPSIPPLKGFAGIEWKSSLTEIEIEAEIAASQTRIDKFETRTPGYGLFNFTVQHSIITGTFIHNFTFAIENLFNKEYRNHLSRIKAILPEHGRNVRIIYKTFF